MPQETDAVTGNQILQEEPRADPQALMTYRSGIAAADAVARPAPNSPLFNPNPGYRSRVRVIAQATGNPMYCVLRAYTRTGGVAGVVATGSAFATNGFGDVAWDVQLDGDDIAVLVEQLIGGSTPAVNIYLSYR